MDKSSPSHSKPTRKKKKKEPRCSDTSSSRSDSLSVSPPLLPDNADLSDGSLISEHLHSISGDSVENDCSYQEIEISHIPSNSSFLVQSSSDDDVYNIERALSGDVAANHTAQSILDEILQNSAFKSDSEHTVVDSNESFNLFEGVNLNDSLINIETDAKSNTNTNLVDFDNENGKVKQLEELLNTKDDAIAALTVELESLRELTSSNQSTLSLNTSTTDYKLYHEEFQNRIVEYQNALVHRDTIIQQLTEALQQSVINREQLHDQSQQFSKEIVELKSELAETSSIIDRLKQTTPADECDKTFKDCSMKTENILGADLNKNLEEQCSLLEETLNLSQVDLLNKLRKCIDVYLELKMSVFKNEHQTELKMIEDKLGNEKAQYESEIVKLQDLLSSLQCDQADIVAVRRELEAKHAQELEELRTYFERKCADLEKHYSEEVFSQQSRKLSDSTSSLEMSDFVGPGPLPMHGPGGDSEPVYANDLKLVNVAAGTQEVIEAADKKLRATSQFLEEQAAEREQERDEAQKEIAVLRDQLREREKDRINHDLIYNEVEHLEQKMRQMSNALEQNDKRLNEVELEKKEAIDKVYFLRDIIRGLENDLETKTGTETKLRDSIAQLKDIIQQQNKLNEELGQRLGLLTSTSEAQQYQEHIDHLEDEVQRLRINKEFAGSEGALKQIKTQLNEFEMSIDKCTRDLEVLHSTVCTTTCSSPSEDVSIRDQINPRSPSVSDECDVPLQQLARLKEKLVKHSRAEDAAVKRIHDLEMELGTFRQDLNEVQNERDLLQDQVSEQLLLISSLQIRLDDQRLRAEHIQKQTNTSLEMRIYDLENEVKDLMEIITNKDKSIKQLNKIVDETKVKLQLQAQELNSNEDYRLIEKLQLENASLLAKINKDAQNAQILPNLVDNILADKNKDIQMLRSKLDKTEAELGVYQSLNFDHEQLKALSRLQGSDRAFSDILSLIDVDARQANKSCESLNTSLELPAYKHNQNETPLLAVPEISSIEKVGEQINIHYSMEAPLTKPNSTEIKSAEKKKVHFQDSDEILRLKSELKQKETTIADYAERFRVLAQLETTIDELQRKLDETEKALSGATETFKKEQLELQEIRIELAEKKMHLVDRERQLESYVQDGARKDQMYIALAKEKRQLETELENQNETIEKIQELEKNLLKKQTELEKLNAKLAGLENIDLQLKRHNEMNEKLSKDIKNLESQGSLLQNEVAELKQVIDDKNDEIERLQSTLRAQESLESRIKELKNLIVDRDTEIEILNEDANRYQDDLAKLENKIKTLKSSLNNEFEIKLAQSARDIAARNLQIEKLKGELDDCKRDVIQQCELINEKDKVIKQVTEDGKSLHVNLETIKSKLNETGNLVDLKNRLKEEQLLNKQLQEELVRLRSDPDTKPLDMTTSIDEITGAVRKQLDYSAHLDSNILNAVGVCDLEELLQQEKMKNAHLQETLDKRQWENSEMLQQLQHEKQTRDMLQRELKRIKHLRKSENTTEFSSLPNLNIQEMIKLTKEVQRLLEENSGLKEEIRNLKTAKVETGANLKYVKDMLQLRSADVAKLEKEVKEIRTSEAIMKQTLDTYKMDFEQKSNEVEHSRILIGELEQEGHEMKKELNRLRERLAKSLETENYYKTNVPEAEKHVPYEFLSQIKELTSLSHSLMQDNKKISRTVKKLSDEKNLLQRRIVELQEINSANLALDDQVAKANHLFARYLRSESYRKALVFQKKYLIGLLVSYQAHPTLPQELTLTLNFRKQRLIRFKIVVISIIAVIRMQNLVLRWNTGKRGYRQPLRLNIPPPSATTFHIGHPVSSQNFPSNSRNRPSAAINNPIPNFSQTSGVADVSDDDADETMRPRTPPSPNDLGVWSGVTPPTKDNVLQGRAGKAILHKRDNSQSAMAFVPLQAPHHLSKYADTLDQIQKRLGTTIDKYS